MLKFFVKEILSWPGRKFKFEEKIYDVIFGTPNFTV